MTGVHAYAAATQVAHLSIGNYGSERNTVNAQPDLIVLGRGQQGYSRGIWPQARQHQECAEIRLQRQRRDDPVKLAVLVLVALECGMQRGYRPDGFTTCDPLGANRTTQGRGERVFAARVKQARGQQGIPAQARVFRFELAHSIKQIEKFWWGMPVQARHYAFARLAAPGIALLFGRNGHSGSR